MKESIMDGEASQRINEKKFEDMWEISVSKEQ